MIVAILRCAFKGVSTRRCVALVISLLSAVYLLCAQSASADTPPPTPKSPLPPSERVSNLDGLYLFVGVGGGARLVNGEYDSTIGGHLSVATLSEQASLSLLAIDLGVSQFGTAPGGHIWLAPALGTRRLGPLMGLSVGASAEWDRTEPPRWGASATAWLFAGVVPFVRAGRHQRSGTFVELGLRLTFPALRLSRQGVF